MTLALPALDLDLGLVDFSLPVNRFRGLQWGAYFSVAVYTTGDREGPSQMTEVGGNQHPRP